jgi:hypothetical protein
MFNGKKKLNKSAKFLKLKLSNNRTYDVSIVDAIIFRKKTLVWNTTKSTSSTDFDYTNKSGLAVCHARF